MFKILRIALNCLCLTLLLSACGGGGGSSSSPTPTPSVPTRAIIKVSTANVPTGTLVGGVQFSIVLPAGVTPSVLSGNDANGSVVASGNAANGTLAASSYDATTRTLTPGIVNVGFASGEFMTITCALAAGTTVTAANFQVSVAGVYDSVNGNIIPGATCQIGVTLQ